MKKDIHNRIIEIEKFMDMKNFYLSSSLYIKLSLVVLDNFIDKKVIYIMTIIYRIINELI